MWSKKDRELDYPVYKPLVERYLKELKKPWEKISFLLPFLVRWPGGRQNLQVI